MANLTIDNVVKTYGQTEVLKGINIAINKGEFLILVGPSGCGKSTLMNSIAGLEDVTGGRILIGDADVTRAAPKDRDIAMVFQSYARYPNMSVRENIAFGLEIRKVPKPEREQEVQRVASLLQIEHLLDRKPGQLSGGQRQRVAMGRALARRPKLYLFDEPLSNLDAKLRVEMRTEIKKLHQRLGTTIVYVTHDQIEAMTLADRIAVMRAGELLQLGTPQEIYDNPANQFVAGFMGSPAMNFVPCRLAAGDNGLGVEILDGNGNPTWLPVPHPERLSGVAGQEVVLGIRPEMITDPVPHKADQPLVRQVPMKVLVTEPTGADTMLVTEINGVEINCRINPGYSTPVGETVPLMFDMSKAVFFDPKNEARIDRG
ncbi:MAG: ABC transporter ATP-binding protein [Oceanospirillaceae bacterium]|nr:ABC transporter ATP-binding protein [Oceanospirillaceae bacterium]